MSQIHVDNRKKIPYARPVPRSFAAAWESNKEGAPRRYSRSPSPRRYDDWHRDEVPPPPMPRPRRPLLDIAPADGVHVIDDSDDLPSANDRIPPPFEAPPPPPKLDQFHEGPDVNSMRPDDDVYHRPGMHQQPHEQDFAHRDFREPDQGLPPESSGWGPGRTSDAVYDEELLLRDAEELYGADYAELLMMDNLDETLLANYERERQAMGLNEPEKLVNLNRPSRPPRGGPRGRGGPPRGRGGRGKPVPLMSLGFDQGRGGPPRRMRRGGRRGMHD